MINNQEKNRFNQFMFSWFSHFQQLAVNVEEELRLNLRKLNVIE